MTCNIALAERLVEITSKPLQNYSIKYVVSGYDPYYGYPDDDSYTMRKFVWDISPRKRLVLTIKDEPTLAPDDQDVHTLAVVYQFYGIPFFRLPLAHKTFPKSVLSTLVQFAFDGIAEFQAKEVTRIGSYNAKLAEQNCLQFLRRLA